MLKQTASCRRRLFVLLFIPQYSERKGSQESKRERSEKEEESPFS